MILSDKRSIARLVDICHQMGVNELVFSPGSRNAPLVISFVESGLFECLCIPDERTAAFFAMGMAIQSDRTVAICCTSGSAALNYAPALSEAYYQGVPLLVLTADRPVEWIDQGVGQSIRQNNVYANYIKKSFEFIQEASKEEDIAANDEISIQALQACQSGFKGPVHINIPLKEPLYGTTLYKETVELPLATNHNADVIKLDFDRLGGLWQKCSRKIILFGMSKPDVELQKLLQYWHGSGQVVILTETSSNCYVDGTIQTIDRLITGFENDAESYRADLLISIGSAVVSKKIKALFLRNKPSYHWHVSEDTAKDTFRALTDYIPMDALSFLDKLSNLVSTNEKLFQDKWLGYNNQLKLKHNEFVESCAWSDFRLFSHLLNAIPKDAILHMGNSTVVRYIQLFDPREDLQYYGNRGVSGIDGCSSTAMGFSYLSEKKNVLITGDIAFYYDSNAFWHKHRPEYLRIILVNNEGGSIFRIIPGPSSTAQLDTYFEAHQKMDARHLCAHHGIKYISAADETEYLNCISAFFDDEPGIKLLEVKTPRQLNDRILADYFEYIHKA